MTKSYVILRHARISMQKFQKNFKVFFTRYWGATKVAQLTGLNRNTVNKYLLQIRKRIAEECETEPPFSRAVEVDEGFFGARRVLEGKEVAEPVAKLSSSGYSNETVNYIRK